MWDLRSVKEVQVLQRSLQLRVLSLIALISAVCHHYNLYCPFPVSLLLWVHSQFDRSVFWVGSGCRQQSPISSSVLRWNAASGDRISCVC